MSDPNRPAPLPPIAELRAVAEAARDAQAEVALSPSTVLALLDRVEALEARRDELLALVARISQETPLPDEVRTAVETRGALLAEIGTLRSRVAELEEELENVYDAAQERDLLDH